MVILVSCPASLCQNDGKCVPDHGDRPSCECLPGFSGPRCEVGKCSCQRAELVFYTYSSLLPDIDECASNPCVSGATCEDGKNGFHCICPQGFMGDRCHRELQ